MMWKDTIKRTAQGMAGPIRERPLKARRQSDDASVGMDLRVYAPVLPEMGNVVKGYMPDNDVALLFHFFVVELKLRLMRRQTPEVSFWRIHVS
jgi:hypothetical protein